jgi:Zn-dependent M28 family amino/carboxypeptidase
MVSLPLFNQNLPTMRRFLILPFVALVSHALAQNSAPTVSITDVTVDEVAQTVTVNYDLSDADSDPCEVWLKYSTDGGEYFAIAEDVSGDAGEEVSPGSRTLSWDFSAMAEGIFGTRIKVVASDGQAVSIADMVAQVSEANLLTYLQAVDGIRHYTAAPARLEEVRTYIEQQFQERGLDTERHAFTYANTPMSNIIGRKAGAGDEAITYIMDGHFDGVSNSPAADDNGSAVAGMLESLRILSQYEFVHSLRFIGFDLEETGITGSLRYVQNGIKPYEDIQGVLNFEMIGFYSDEPNSQQLPAGFELLFPQAAQQVADNEFRGDFLTVVGNTASNPLTTTFVNTSTQYVPDLKLVVTEVPGTGTMAPDLRRSDHSRFWDAGKQALMLTDGANFRNFNYHTPADSIGTLNLSFMADVVRATLATAATLAVPIVTGSDEYDLSVLSIGDHDHAHGFPGKVRIYPNPTDGVLMLHVNAVHPFRTRAEVYDLSGRQLLREVMEFGNGDSVNRLDVGHLSNGSYLLVLHAGGEGALTHTFVVEK